jgi:hypothetical protein
MKNLTANRNIVQSKINICQLFVFLLLTLSVPATYGNVVNSTFVKKFAQSFINAKLLGRTIDSVLPLKSSDGHAVGYVVELNPEGYVVLSNDTDIYPIILYSSKGLFDLRKSSENIPLDLVIWDLEARERYKNSKESAEIIKQKNNTIWNSYVLRAFLNKSVQNDIYGPLLTTNWDQGGYFNNYCPMDPVPLLGIINRRSIVGCVATAAAQILNYWQYPKKIIFNNNDSYASLKNTDREVKIPDDAGIYDFPTFDVLNSNLSSMKYDGDHTEIGYLSFAVGIKLGMNYSANGSGTYQSAKFYRDLGYGSANISSWSNSYNEVINNIIAGWPVQVSIYNDSNEGHSIVFDGFDTSNGSFHINMGWSGSNNGWYIPPELDTHYDFNIMGNVVYDICPYQGWSQWGADDRNTHRSFYAIPSEVTTKWNVKTDQDRYRCKGLIVSQSSNIIVSNSPMDLKQNIHPSIMLISLDGTKKCEIFLENEDASIGYPVQNSDGTIYVGTGTGKIYSVNATTAISNLIFQDPSGSEINQNLKIDEDDFIYAVTDTKLFCISPNGNKKWQVSTDANSYFFARTPAIDVSRNRVYIGYQNTANKTSGLISINRLNGNILNTKTFSNMSNSNGVGISSIAENGDVYFGCNTKLYVLHPENNYSLDELYDNGFGFIFDAPTISKNGTIYFYCWKATNLIIVNSLNPSNGQINWEIPFGDGEIGQYGSIQNVYVDNNQDVCVTLHYHSTSEETYTLRNYKDNGSSVSYIWSREIGNWGGFVAFGPDKTLYYSNLNQLTAVAELPQGQISFPNYTNNTPPNQPSYINPSNGIQDADTSLTFSWSCSDPDGHSIKYFFYLGYANRMLDIYKTDLTTNSLHVDGLKADSVYLWSITATDGQSITQGPIWSFKIKSSGTGIKNQANTKLLVYSLNQNYPNPFNPTTILQYEIPKSSNVKLIIYNTLGQSVKTLVNEEKNPGKYTVSFNAGALSGGIYFYTIKAGDFVETKKMVLLK